MMKWLLLSSLLFCGCNINIIINPRTRQVEVADADSLFEVIQNKNDFKKIKFSIWVVDSLEKRMNLSLADSLLLAGRGRAFRANWLDNERILRGHKESKLTTILDSTFQNTALILYHSNDDLSAVTEEYIYKKMNDELTSVFAVSSVKTLGFKFRNNGEFNTFVNSFDGKYFRSPKKRGNTTYYASDNTGDDLNDPCSGGWGDACKTIGATLNDLTAGDSLVAVGTFTEAVAPTSSGSAGSKIVMIDSLAFTNGLTLNQPDTTNLWSAIIDAQSGTRSSCVTLSGDDYITIIGWHLTGASAYNLRIQAGSDNNALYQVKSRNGTSAAALFEIEAGPNDSLISCLGIANTNNVFGIELRSGLTSTVLINNTIYGSFTNSAILFDGDNNAITVRNNIFQNTSTTAGDYAGRVNNGDQGMTAGTWDHNIWLGAESGGNTWLWAGSGMSDIAVWRDSVDNRNAGNEANAQECDPSLQSVTTTCYIQSGSCANDNGNDLGYGGDVGWWQLAAAAPEAPAGTPGKAGPRHWGYNEKYDLWRHLDRHACFR